ncbi:MAG: segregation/condensation protein A, partial [Anaerovoracaceae bacterium]
MAYKVRLEIFEGPFDLLVYLIENAKMNIYDIQVSEITAQYIDYVKELQQMDVAVSSDFMVLAAELIELKSKLLLPRVAVTGGEAVDEDPRAELAEKLLAYKSFKHISKMLSEKEDESACIRTKPKEDLSLYTKETEELLELDIDRFVSAFNLFLGKKK